MGIDKRAVRKVWAVEKIPGARINWQFHVSTIVRGPDQKWYAIDDQFGGSVGDVADWERSFAGENPMAISDYNQRIVKKYQLHSRPIIESK